MSAPARLDLVALRASLFPKLIAQGARPERLELDTAFRLHDRDQPRGGVRCLGAAPPGNPDEWLSKLTGLNEAEKQVDLLLDVKPRVGDKCPKLQVYAADSSAAQTELAFDDQCVYLLDFWATWCAPCQKPMNHNQAMMVKNPRWEAENHAKIVCISVDDSVATMTSKITKWNKLQHYWAGEKSFEEQAPSAFAVQSIPFCVLVHRGIVVWQGHPSAVELDKAINALIDGKSFDFPAPEPAEADDEEDLGSGAELSNAEFNDIVKRGTALFEEIQRGTNADTMACMDIFCVIKSHLNADDAAPTHKYHFAISGTVPETAKDIVEEEVFLPLAQIFPQLDNACDYLPVSTVHRASKCSLCRRAIGSSEAQYVCMHCGHDDSDMEDDEERPESAPTESHAHCVDCHDKPRPGKVGTASLAHPHACYFIPATATQRQLETVSVNRWSQLPLPQVDGEPTEEQVHFERFCSVGIQHVC
jgi:thiol-disulfide isomerase/thioredoxin